MAIDLNAAYCIPYHSFYIRSMSFCCESAIDSAHKINSLFSVLPEKPTFEDTLKLSHREILNEMQNIVIQGGALSRYFWPVRKDHFPRGEFLRKALKISDSSALKDRGLRNAIEHFDERLDNYLSSGINGIIVPEYVGPRLKEGKTAGHTFRAYFMGDEIFKLLDEEFEIPPIVNEIARISLSLSEIDKSGSTFKIR
ncbi:hypothetical protein O3W44_22430 [Pantoea sp. LMR881]|uniref:hypothetical protein n=1 Tax=Pantoea sp. LMR881 TaxID=3014336 RepID=UPI0022AF02BB|nr:hypothetical protein [Pantoea sp. LMR881]MCZ4061180.1 hypothetical protein [Pantoea sp. LMR881]MCZ4061291.1 hypothetical protein [Pantoea sp. LMR881]